MLLEGEELTQQDANANEDSSAPQESPSPETTEVSAKETSAPESQMPFHEHPRFKELIEERKEFQKRQEAYEARMADMERKYQEALTQRTEKPKEANEFIERLRAIDPKYAAYIEGLEAKAGKAESLTERLDRIESERVAQQFETKLSALHSENKVPAEMQARIKSQIEYLAISNPNLGMNDLPRVYKEVLEQENQYREQLRKAERASYVQEKTKDSKAPTTPPKGKIASHRQEKQAFKSRDDFHASVVQAALKSAKAESDI